MAPFFKKHKDTDKAGKKGGTGKEEVKPEGKAKTTGAGAADALALAGSPSAEPALLLNDEDEEFLERLVSNDNEDDEDGPPPPLPPRPKTPDLVWDDSESFRVSRSEEGLTTTAPAATATAATTTTTKTTTKKPNRLSRIFHRKHSTSTTLTVPSSTAAEVTPEEADREWADLNRVLSPLGIEPADPDSPDAPNKGAKNSSSTNTTTTTTTKAGKTSRTKAAALTASAEIQSLLRQFVVVLKDIMRGAPTAVDDLTALLDGRNDVLRRGFEKLPSSMQKLVTQLPKKLTSSLGPDVLAAAAEARGLKKEDTDAGGLARFLMPKTLNDLVLTPAIVKSMLKAIVNTLKVRWPAFVGTNVLWSAAVFLLLFVLWYFHKRGKEEREKREKEAAEREAGEGKVDEKEVSV
ncbi:hypothetical protein MYCTH_2309963 [Thermothelomyces thermophilus ATCC 42464]|uniref:Ring-like domain-containing protein n=1 Tax=Thermothelomyces thermophilus (strain ATCC 42464 / BCRC 31852 / DSM 1799) TaxID=573729 RepID=G2QKW9_THET4|nr:uncharacterized protein MYCTH_2309963 [Thermothelomyces thermophilus ATCC 42464]AEO60601.1 hypothetical protein MYCTH_2309963 [Thermothelomyces thermophilus ATCC 42464]